LTQSRLQAKARPKFGEFAAGLLFTEAGVEQATRLKAAAHHANRFRAAGFTHVADLTCGIGADALALAALGLRVTAIEIDEETAALATLNLARFPQAQVIMADARTWDFEASGAQALFADPSRRAGGARTFNPACYSPPLNDVLELRHRRPLGVKTAPGLPHAAVPADAEAQWVSDDGDVLEAGLWFGPLRDAPGRTALVLKGAQAHRLASTGAEQLRPAPLGAYLHEPDGAVIRASLIHEAAKDLPGAALVHPRIAYVTADQPSASPFLTAYRVLDWFPFSLRRLKAYLRVRGVGALTIKKRGTAISPDQLRRQCSLSGPNAATIFLTRLGDQHSVIVAEPAGRT
jgi:SAM-dependent methyltransferase